MERSSVVHISEQPYAYAVGKDTLRVRLRVRVGDCTAVFVHYKNLYDHTAPYTVKEMQPILRGEFSVLYESEIRVPERHFKYLFELRAQDEALFYTGDGFLETVHETNCFYYPVINADDIVAPPAWAKGGLIYQVFVDRFFNGDPTNDPEGTVSVETLPGRSTHYGGDLQGVAQKLGYIKALGADMIYLSPVMKSPTYHKYDVADYYAVDEALGGKEALAVLIDKAHEKGLRLVLDAVFNHCSAENPLFQDVISRGENSPYSRWFLIDSFPVSVSACNYDTFAGAVPSMPRFDTSNPEVIEYLTDAALYWTKELRVDGWRLDVADEVSHTLWRELRRKLKAYDSDVLIIGEVWNHASRWLRGDQFDTVTNYKFRSNLIALAQGRTAAEAFWRHMSTNKMLYMTPLYPYLIGFAGTHDTARSMTVLEDPRLHILAMAAVLTMEGIPLVYYGDEVGMEGGEDPDNRRAMRWDLTETPLAAEIRALARFRAGSKALREGDTAIIDAGSRVLAFQRKLGTESLTVILNFGADEAAIPGEYGGVLFGKAEITEKDARVARLRYAIVR
jgi:glycosidase